MKTLLASFVLVANLAVSQPECHLKADENGIKVYRCKTTDSNFRSVKAVFELDTSLEAFSTLLRDVDSYRDWQFNTVQSKLLATDGPNDITYYAEIASPWPFENRDVVAHLSCKGMPSDSAMRFVYNGRPDFIPEVRGKTRIPRSASEFQVTRISPGRIKVEYYSSVDPGGNVPAWVMNQICEEGPFRSFKKLKEIMYSSGPSVRSDK